LRPFVPALAGNLEFRVWKKPLERIDEILRMSQVEGAFVRLSLTRQKERKEQAAAGEGRPAHILSPGEQVLFPRRAAQALHCMPVRTLTGEGLQPIWLSPRLAVSLQAALLRLASLSDAMLTAWRRFQPAEPALAPTHAVRSNAGTSAEMSGTSGTDPYRGSANRKSRRGRQECQRYRRTRAEDLLRRLA
jgi:hypothetical protein